MKTTVLFLCLLCTYCKSRRSDIVNINSCSHNLTANSTIMLEGTTNCSSLEYYFGNEKYILNFTFELTNKSSVTLTGESQTVIQCKPDKSAGIKFDSVSEVVLQNIHLQQCGSVEQDAIETKRVESIIINSVMISGSKGEACSITESSTILIKNSIFEGNQKGLYIHTEVSQSNINLEDNIFKNNSRVSIYIEENNATITISNCTFQSNEGNLGGGLHISLREVKDVYVNFSCCTFANNEANYSGGGFYVAFYSMRKNSNIIMTIANTHFCANSAALYGGGSYMLLEALADAEIKTIFQNCFWERNKAESGAAIKLKVAFADNTHGSVFENCSFCSNEVSNINNLYKRRLNQKTFSKGSFVTTRYNIVFKGYMEFYKNSGTALCLVSARLEMERDTNITFNENRGSFGGALALYELSYLKLHSGVYIHFNNNSALTKGGAIFITMETTTIDNCSFQVVPPAGLKDNNIKLLFTNNYISNDYHNTKCSSSGHSIYIYSINKCENDEINLKNNTGIINFSFDKSSYKCEIATDTSIVTTSSNSLECIPGKGCALPIAVQNDYGSYVKNLIHLKLQANQSIHIHSSSELILPNTKVILHGISNATDTLMLLLASAYEHEHNALTNVSITLLQCPPGYILQENSCNCHSHYVGITNCKNETFQAILTHAYWMGYREDFHSTKYGNEDRLYSAMCPRRYCHTISKQKVEITLPNTSNIQELDYTMCGPHRTGFLCANCRENHSVFYHSESFDCFPDHLCWLGWLFFLCSEIVPVTVIFMIIIFFNIKLTSGSIQGFLLYTQIFDTLLITANQHINFKEPTSSVLEVLQVVYRMLNLEFFTHHTLSFCLWKQASSSGIISMKYVTISYSLFLVIFVVFAWNKCCIKVKICQQNIGKNSIVHGLSSFLIMCYSQCTKVSLLLLTPATVYGKNSVKYKQVLFYNGELDFLKGVHLMFAIVVILAASPLILPPILLFAYPLCYKVFALFRIPESMLSKAICMAIPLERFRPFFDSFQSCFKDEYRCFAGLYFFYRLLTLLSFAAVHSLTTFYTLVQIQLILMLLLHTWIQPYKNKWHNQLDSYIFCTLAILNSITIFNFQKSFKSGEPSENTSLASAIQVALGYIPILVMAMQCAYIKRSMMKKLWEKIPILAKVHIFRKKHDNEETLLTLQESRDDMELSSSYRKK